MVARCMLRPIVLVDPSQDTFVATMRVLQRIDVTRALLPLSPPSLVRDYLRDAVVAGRTPALVILRVRERDQEVRELHDWIRLQPDPIGRVPVLMLTDRIVLDADGEPEVWIERGIRTHVSEQS